MASDCAWRCDAAFFHAPGKSAGLSTSPRRTLAPAERSIPAGSLAHDESPLQDNSLLPAILPPHDELPLHHNVPALAPVPGELPVCDPVSSPLAVSSLSLCLLLRVLRQLVRHRHCMVRAGLIPLSPPPLLRLAHHIVRILPLTLHCELVLMNRFLQISAALEN